MDFYRIKERSIKRGITEVYVDFRVCRSKDLMVRGKSFYAIWDEGRQLWSTDEYDVQRLIDEDLTKYADKVRERTTDMVTVRYMSEFSSGAWVEFRRFLQNISDSSRQLDETITFSNTEVKKEDYISKRLNYPLEKGEIKAYDEIIGTLYEPDERAKLEWAIGSIVAGDAKISKVYRTLWRIGAGKSTILNIIQKLFEDITPRSTQRPSPPRVMRSPRKLSNQIHWSQYNMTGIYLRSKTIRNLTRLYHMKR